MRIFRVLSQLISHYIPTAYRSKDRGTADKQKVTADRTAGQLIAIAACYYVT